MRTGAFSERSKKMKQAIAVVVVLAGAATVFAQEPTPAPRTLEGYVVAVEATKVTISNVPLGGPGGGGTFVMRQDVTKPAAATDAKAPADVKAPAGAPQWTAAAPESQPRERKMMMMTTAPGSAKLELTELQTSAGAVAAADFPQGTPVTVTWTESEGAKRLQKITRRQEPPAAK
jgi:hypothetical protein